MSCICQNEQRERRKRTHTPKKEINKIEEREKEKKEIGIWRLRHINRTKINGMS